ncbi:MAG TPA: protein translocase subunit SecD [Longimicrobiaceae bacterium]|nr:protein translocase subunit SecD [Longimicrobiaceae bacterium]
MFKTLKARFALLAAVSLLSGWLLIQNGITLGLDLRGGTHLALEVDDPEGTLTATQTADAIDRALKIIRTRVNQLGVAEPAIQKVGDDRIVVELPGASEEDQQRAKDVIEKTAFLQFQIVEPLAELQSIMPRIDRAVEDALGSEALDAEAPATGVDALFEPAAADSASGDTTLAGALFEPAAGDSAQADSVTSARPFSTMLLPMGIRQGANEAVAEFYVAEEDVAAVQRALALPEVQRLLPRGSEFVWGFEAEGDGPVPGMRPLYLLEVRPMMTGEYLEDAQAQRDPQFGQPEVTFEISRRGGRIFERATGDHIGDAMAIVLDDRVFSAPNIEGQISTSGRITMGGSTIEEARDLALVLRAGALPVPIHIVEERTIGPSLGSDSIQQGQIAGIIGIVLVVLIMIGYYRFAGFMAVIALAFYLLFVLGSLASINAALTLPGIAGIVLSIGMAVDANVLIFERIREELDLGRSPRIAVSEGFSNALSAIVDGQLTTLITAFVLFQFGTGPVQGFAVTLAIGIVASLFTAIFVTRTFFMLYLSRRPTAQGVSI